METYRNTCPPSRFAWERIQATLPDMTKKPSLVSEKDYIYNMFNIHGDLHPCQEMFNKWIRCRQANPASFDASLACRKYHEDYLECHFTEKTNIRNIHAKKLWTRYENAKAQEVPEEQGGLKQNIKQFRPIYSY
mmetsp:Transcript_31040/g.50352  ORF Transcript_31040/g.50352 Transcript_31040/m.50352 type:complete len:134 (+) Transcript_31040:125-526(+)|eukprot:CAMPEP_0202694326 /NCGR_PEP_ID=MMETSP1385-20130828/8215_1 /ASSEMBLY_ACC=CAM_ASM_000861 /TAXON_ID=933848 /ORGANISM="Elphidium margaritaceum" /LENGTH=133 /DNA_ID=CAMNT_0049350145 /DNA_START=125 /DNA_END=526 /DNA_ORIENTATION=+